MARKKILEKAKHLGVMIEEDIHSDLEYFSKKLGMNMSEAVRESLEIWIEKNKKLVS